MLNVFKASKIHQLVDKLLIDHLWSALVSKLALFASMKAPKMAMRQPISS